MHTRAATVAIPAVRELTPGSLALLRYARSYPGEKEQVARVRAFLREVLVDRPRTDDAVAVGSELAANACQHSQSGVPGGMFTIRAEVSEGDYLLVMVQDAGGPWDCDTCDVVPQHGLDLVEAIAGPKNWGITGDEAGRAVWARLFWPGAKHLAGHPTEAEAAAEWANDEIAELGRQAGKLAEALAARCLAADMAIRPDGLPYLAVYAPEMPALTERVYPQADWFFWATTAERIAAADDVDTAADVIARRLQDWDGPASA